MAMIFYDPADEIANVSAHQKATVAALRIGDIITIKSTSWRIIKRSRSPKAPWEVRYVKTGTNRDQKYTDKPYHWWPYQPPTFTVQPRTVNPPRRRTQ